MTIKPQNGITTKPFNGTSAPTDTVKDNATVTTPVVEPTTLPLKYNDSQSLETTEATHLAVNASTSTTIKSLEITATETVIQLNNKNVTNSTPGPVAASTPSCKKGFVVNQKGDCELKLQGTGNA